MVASGAMCFGGAVMARRWVGIGAAAVMLLAMLDLTFFKLLPPLLWGAALLLAGIALGIDLRLARRLRACGTPDPLGVSRSAGLDRGVMLTSALAYPATAWLVVAHSAGGSGLSEGAGSGAHSGHGSGSLLTGIAPTVGVVLLVAILLVCAIVALRRSRRFLALESGGMAAMLAAMLVGH